MIVSGDIDSILYRDLKPMGFEQFRKNAVKNGKVTSERVVIIAGTLQEGIWWDNTIAEIHICVPDLQDNANTKRLTEIERMFKTLTKTSTYDGSTYRYSVLSTAQEEDTSLRCHYVNVRLLFEVLNVK